MRQTSRFTSVRIQDNGCGISAAALRDPSSIGLLGMRERAELGYIQAVAQRYRDTLQLFVAMGGGGFEALTGTAATP